MRIPLRPVLAVLVLLLPLPAQTVSLPWLQAGGGPERAGARGESLRLPLRLRAAYEVGEAVLGGVLLDEQRVYALDQTGRLHGHPLPGVPESDYPALVLGEDSLLAAPSGNTSTPVRVGDLLVWGTAQGLVRARSVVEDLPAGGRPKSWRRDLGWPIVSPLLAAGERVYVPTIDGSVHAFTAQGELRWRYDHFGVEAAVRRPAGPEVGDGAPDLHYSPVCLAAKGDLLVAGIGKQVVALRDHGDRVEQLWSVKAPATRFDRPAGISIEGEWAYVAWPKSDGEGCVVRHALRDGRFTKKERIKKQWAVLAPPSVRGGRAVWPRHAHGLVAHDFGAGGGPEWQSWRPGDHASLAPTCSQVLYAGDQVLAVDLHGRLRVHSARDGSLLQELRLPAGVVSTSAPALCGGRVAVGADDGRLYVFEDARHPERPVAVKRVAPSRNPPRAKRAPRTHTWPAAFGQPDNRSWCADECVKPPFRLRWALATPSTFKHPVLCAEGALVHASMEGFVVCRDPETGHVRWRHRLPAQGWSRSTPLIHEGRVYVPRAGSPRYPVVEGQRDALFCLDLESGRLLWSADTGGANWLRASPVAADGVVAYGTWVRSTASEAFAERGQPWRWNIDARAPGAWQRPGFDDREWGEGLAPLGQQPECATRFPASEARPVIRLRREVSIPRVPNDGSQLHLRARYDDAFIVWLDGVEVLRVGVPASGRAEKVLRHGAVGWESFPLPEASRSLGPGPALLAVEVLAAPGDASDAFFDAELLYEKPSGAFVQAFDTETGIELWRRRLEASGKYLEGPGGTVREGLFVFSGGGCGEGARGETLALRPRTGEVVWRNREAWTHRTGAPSWRGERIFLSGAVRQPLTGLSARDGRTLWRNESVRDLLMVHPASVGPEFFVVNTKYTGGAKLYSCEDGTRLDGAVDVAGHGHGCGTVVLLASGHALVATASGLATTDWRTGALTWTSPGFASQTCPHPIAARGGLYYASQYGGLLLRFDPDAR